MTTDALWSVVEIRTQAEQSRGQLDIWECLQEVCSCEEPMPLLSSSPCPVHGAL